jgi:apolipoprotein N-acyltransferase
MNLSVTQKAYLWAIAAGICYVLSFPQYDLPLLGIFFLPAFLSAIHYIRTKRQAILIGFLLSSMVAWGGFHWIIYVAQYFGQMPLPLAIGLLCLYCLIAAPQMVLFSYLGFRFRYSAEKLPVFFRPLLWAALYVALEHGSRFVKIFPESLGNTWVHFSQISQIASFGGVALLSFLPLYLGATLVYCKKERWTAIPALGLALGIVTVAHFWGGWEIQRLENLPKKTLRVGIVQHNMDDAETAVKKGSALTVFNQVVSKLLDFSESLATSSPKPDLILWPETAFFTTFPTRPDSLLGSFGYANLVKDFVHKHQVPLLFGTYETDEESHDYNVAVLLDGKSAEILSLYRKNVLLIFGEYFPFLSYFPWLKKLNPLLGDFGRGPGPVPMHFPHQGQDLKLGANICYEAILPEYMRGYALAGAHVFVNLTKDSWFGNTFEPWQHFQLSQLRSIEHRLPMVRSTNTGLSGTVSLTGKVEFLSPPFQEAKQTVEVAYFDPPRATLYTLWGDWFAALCAVLSLGFLVLSYRKP